MIEATGRRVTRQSLIATLGSHYTSGFSDSSDSDFEHYLKWQCGCSARKGGLTVDWWWHYAPCTEHDREQAAP